VTQSAEPETATPAPSGDLTPSAPSEAPGQPQEQGKKGEPSPERPEKPESKATQRTDRIAFRIGSTVYTAKEDGTGAPAVDRSHSGPYALSPDSRTLAVISDGVLQVVDVSSGKASQVGPADENLRPCWEPDSSHVFYRRRGEQGLSIWRVGRSGTGAAEVIAGQQIGISNDGRVLVAVPERAESMPDGSGSVHVSIDGGEFRRVLVRGGSPTAAATNGRLLFVAITGASGNAVASIKTDGRSQRQLTGAPPGSVPAIWGRIFPSPDGSQLAMSALGDDGYARTFLLSSSGGGAIKLTQRRDTAFHSWSPSGKFLFLIEGNAFQGEPTALVRVRNDGSGRRTIVTGAE
jgi:Tol biopolymer transport system component